MTIKSFLKKYIWLIVVLASIPVLTLLTFSICADGFHCIIMSGGDWATLVGAILGYLGTSFLGVLAFWQNEVIQYNSDNYNKKLFDLQMISNAPSFDCKYDGCNSKFKNIRITLTNTSENVAKNISLSALKIFNSGEELYKSNSSIQSKVVLRGTETISTEFDNPELFEQNLTLKFSLECTDKYDKLHYYEICGTIDENKENRIVFTVTKITTRKKEALQKNL